MLLDLPGVTTEQYDRLNDELGPSPGLYSHVCAATADGLLICDVWRSQAELDRFLAEVLGPATARLGLPPARPRTGRLHAKLDPR